jgi:hypothetical protein
VVFLVSLRNLDDIASDPFFDIADNQVLADLQERSVVMKESKSMISIRVVVCDENYSFEKRSAKTSSWPGSVD